MDSRTLLTILFCFLIFLFWQKAYIDPRLPQQTAQVVSSSKPETPQTVKTESSAKTVTTQPTALTPAPEIVTPRPIEARLFDLGDSTFFVNNQNGLVSGWELKKYHLGEKTGPRPIDLFSVSNQKNQGDLAFDSQEFAYLSGVTGSFMQTSNGKTWIYEDEKIKLTRDFAISSENAFVDYKVRAEFKTTAPKFAFLSLSLQGMNDDHEAQDRQIVYWTNKEINRTIIENATELKEVVTPVKWIGVTSRYFIASLIPQGGIEPKGLVQPLGDKKARVSLVYPVNGSSIDIPVRVFFGPKELNLLRSVEPTMDLAVDFGWFTIIAYPLLKLMKFFYQLFHNYGVSIILLTLLVKIITYPLNYKSMKSMREMAKIQPQIQKIRDKYKDDKEALNREMLVVMKSHGYNPMAGCLPILVQMPIFFALYQVLYSAIELYQAPFIFWIHDLSAKDPFYVTPILLTLTMFIQQKLTPNTATDPMQAKMLQFMPIMFGFLMIALPSGLTLYMLINALASIVQQIILNKKFDGAHGPLVPSRAG